MDNWNFESPQPISVFCATIQKIIISRLSVIFLFVLSILLTGKRHPFFWPIQHFCSNRFVRRSLWYKHSINLISPPQLESTLSLKPSLPRATFTEPSLCPTSGRTAYLCIADNVYNGDSGAQTTVLVIRVVIDMEETRLRGRTLGGQINRPQAFLSFWFNCFIIR